MRVDYFGIAASIVKHLQTALPHQYHITQSIQEALGVRKEDISVLVLFNGFTHSEPDSLSPTTPARDANYRIGIVARGDSTDAQKKALDIAVSLIEQACNCDEPGSGYGHGWPIFGRTELDIERAIMMSADPPTFSKEHGLTTSMTLVVRIIESS